MSGRVLEALDKARLDRNYVSPAYLRDDLAEFLTTQDRGVFWLQAPAHVGKTTFVQVSPSRRAVTSRSSRASSRGTAARSSRTTAAGNTAPACPA